MDKITGYMVDAVVWVVVSIMDLSIAFLETVLSVFPASGPGFPGGGMPVVDLGWIASVVDLGAFGGLMAWVASVEFLIIGVASLRWLWGWVKW
jgi:hypothetical protein